MAARQSAGGDVRCPAGKVAVGGGSVPDPGTGRQADSDKLELVASGPLLPTDNGGYGWTITVRNTGSRPMSVVVAAICVTLR